jgi:hypothetical protein
MTLYTISDTIYDNLINKKLNLIDILILPISDVNMIIYNLLLKCSFNIVINNKNITNYKYSYYQPVMDYIIHILTTHPQKKELHNTQNNKLLLYHITISSQGQKYLKLIKYFINFSDIQDEYLLLSVSKGTLGTFLFWKKHLNIDILNENNYLLFQHSIINSDNRIFKWYLNIIKQKKLDNLFFTPTILNYLLCSLLQNYNIPNKFKLKRLKLLNDSHNLNPYFSNMILYCIDCAIILPLLKYYYIEELSIVNIKHLAHLCINNNNDYINIYNNLKTNNEKILLSLYRLFTNEFCSNNTLNCNLIININNFNNNIDNIFKNLNLTLILNNNFDIQKIEILSDFYNFNCKCKNNCCHKLLMFIKKNNLFHYIKNDNIEQIHYGLLLLTKFYVPTQYNINEIIILKINKLLSYLRIYIKKKQKEKILKFKIKYLHIHDELLYK